MRSLNHCFNLIWLIVAINWNPQMIAGALTPRGRLLFLTALLTPLGSSNFASVSDNDVFSPKEYRPFRVMDIKRVSPNTKRYRFSLSSSKAITGLPVSSLIMVKGPPTDKGEEVARPYTPITLGDVKGHFDLIIKTYPHGHVSSYMDTLKVGNTVEVKGPFCKLPYTANMRSTLGMVAGGTGITPMLQVIRTILNNPTDVTKVHLVFANVTPDDILMKHDLDNLAAKHSNFEVTYVVNDAPHGSKVPTGEEVKNPYEIGYVTKDLLTKTMPMPCSKDPPLIYVCGPPGMMKAICGEKEENGEQGPVKGILSELNYTAVNTPASSNASLLLSASSAHTSSRN